MISSNLSATWPSLVPAFGNHLWQSTVFVIAAGLLTLVLRQNHARFRYWLWLVASVKFLIPFSLLVALGSYLSGAHTVAGTNAAFYIAVEEVSQPFTQPTMPVIPQVAASTGLTQLLPLFLAVVWLCGFLVVIFHWYFRWRRISVAIRKSVPLQEGREVQALRRLERATGMGKATEMLLSRTSLEPGVFGITRPVLLWPEGISERLEDSHLEAILAHELWHVRRRDNLAAAIHMVVEAIFWFHPLVWWLGARLVEERERACDEKVLESGSDRQVYAESILKICEFCVGSPLACVTGVTGADLKKRMAYIMTRNLSRELDFSRKLLLSASGLLALAAPIAVGLLHVTQTRAQSQGQSIAVSGPGFVSVSIRPNKTGEPMAGFNVKGLMTAAPAAQFKPDRFMATNFTLRELIRLAYGVHGSQIFAGPGWIDSEKYDIEAKVGSSSVDELGKLSPDRRYLENQGMIQALLADRFKLTLHHETKEIPAYVLVIAKHGAKLHEAKPGDTYPDGFKDFHGHPVGAGHWLGPCKFVGQGVPVADLARDLSQVLDRVVLDQTGLNGVYDFTVDCHAAFMERGESLLAVLPEQLGLELKPETAPVEVLVIDHAENPAESQAQSAIPAVPAFETASIKPNNGEPMAGFEISGKPFNAIMWKGDRLMATNFTLHGLLRVAYAIQDDQISGGPDWLNLEGFDVDAKIGKSTIDEMQKRGRVYGVSGRTLMFQALLSDRFKLSFHRETRDLPVFALVIAQNGPKIHPAKPGDTYPNGVKCFGGRPCGGRQLNETESNRVVGQGIPLSDLVELLSEKLRGRIVVDKTGLTGDYDFTLQLAPEESEAAISKALEEQLGLRLEPQEAPMEVLVIDHAEKPSGN